MASKDAPTQICKGRVKKGEGKNDLSGSSRKKPKRPLHAYNLFYKFDRERLLAGGENTDLPVTVEDVRRLSRQAKHMPRRAHRKAHGKIAFLDLCRTIADRWKNLPPESKKVFEEQAELEKQEYDEKIAKWNEEQQKDEHSKNDAASAGEAPDSSVDHVEPDSMGESSEAGGDSDDRREDDLKYGTSNDGDDRKPAARSAVNSGNQPLSFWRLQQQPMQPGGDSYTAVSFPGEQPGTVHYDMEQERQRIFAVAHRSRFHHSSTGSGLTPNVATSSAIFAPNFEPSQRSSPFNTLPLVSMTYSSSLHAAPAGDTNNLSSDFDYSRHRSRAGASQDKQNSEMGTLLNPLDEETMDNLFD